MKMTKEILENWSKEDLKTGFKKGFYAGIEAVVVFLSIKLGSKDDALISVKELTRLLEVMKR